MVKNWNIYIELIMRGSGEKWLYGTYVIALEWLNLSHSFSKNDILFVCIFVFYCKLAISIKLVDE